MTTRVYVLARFKPKLGKEAELFEVLKALEPDSYREAGCVQYMLTRQIDHPSASRDEYPIVFNEIWETSAAWSAHGRRQQIQHFFATQVSADSGLVADVVVTAYSDEGYQFDAPVYE
ncbi:putative quinol monooxygenase [Shewanella sp. NIFS-20-20]|uniref:putative quinol monooxygenase n=1 Tax=Shewanella sp. NIFS-20-20 TaxID=2853806 RepID=UPI001C43F949|nr:antibiotic biosynthesis monooxygenase [Shewanella sp. NIFS-20-20]MBV7315536.1 antibiotic biosynthesis monooxygenase [Shewanella sp. NIFS-20-20]